jgi:TP901 family phage tail tape measure protein
MAFVIPTIYTAVDKVSAVAQRVAAANANIAASAELAAAKASHAWDKFMPETDDALKPRFQFMVSMGKAMAIAGTAIYSTKAIMDYEKELANLKALTGATGVEFEGYKRIIQDVAKQTTVSSVDIAQAFTAIGNAMPELLGSADALGQMTNAAVTLGRAANMDMLPAAEALTGIMNQFGKSADFAATAVDMLAAGSQAGSAELQDLQATMLSFGKAAAVSGIKFEEAINLTELISKTRKGSEAGVQLRNIFIEMNKGAKIDEKALKSMMRLGINTRLISDATVPVKQRLQEMTKALKDPTALAEIFGKENAVAAVALLQNVAAFDAMNERIKETGVAAKMAKEQTQTLYAALNRVKAAWTNIITESGGANAALTLVKWTLGAVANNLGLILNIAVPILGFFAAWRLRIIYLSMKAVVLNNAFISFNYIVSLTNALLGKQIAAMYVTEAGMKAVAHATVLMKLSMWEVFGILAIVSASVYALGSFLNRTYGSADMLNKKIIQTKNGFEEVREPITAATTALKMYNKAHEKFLNQQDARKRLESFGQVLRETGKSATLGDLIAMIPDIYRVGGYNAFLPNFLQAQKLAEPTKGEFGLTETNEYRGTRSTNVNLKSTPVEIVLKDTRGNVLGTGSSSLMPSITNTY